MTPKRILLLGRAAFKYFSTSRRLTSNINHEPSPSVDLFPDAVYARRPGCGGGTLRSSPEDAKSALAWDSVYSTSTVSTVRYVTGARVSEDAQWQQMADGRCRWHFAFRSSHGGTAYGRKASVSHRVGTSNFTTSVQHLRLALRCAQSSSSSPSSRPRTRYWGGHGGQDWAVRCGPVCMYRLYCAVRCCRCEPGFWDPRSRCSHFGHMLLSL